MLLASDANVLVGEALRKRGHALLSDSRLDLRMTDRAVGEARYQLSARVELVVDRENLDLDRADALRQRAFEVIDEFITIVPRREYAEYLDRAAYRIPRDPDDAPTVALALALGGDEGQCGIWTNDGDFLGCGIPTWTTETLLAHLDYTP